MTHKKAEQRRHRAPQWSLVMPIGSVVAPQHQWVCLLYAKLNVFMRSNFPSQLNCTKTRNSGNVQTATESFNQTEPKPNAPIATIWTFYLKLPTTSPIEPWNYHRTSQTRTQHFKVDFLLLPCSVFEIIWYFTLPIRPSTERTISQKTPVRTNRSIKRGKGLSD